MQRIRAVSGGRSGFATWPNGILPVTLATEESAMPGFDSGPAPPTEPHDDATTSRNTRYGLTLFFIYLVIYGAFVLVSAYWPDVMDRVPFVGLNLAILSGF